ncbi:nuclear transport factor 2 family protein [Opitutus terrae]|uniref:DUF4440 domain-containing protein n=1 Tax=Opitutus terrae (strain DSM 11246 / JCM 15787 / PB90-1) TaxID=452637 RepID=B1ZSV9_OPITP|nr:nuclear transport factor 2 family protein [Opitutus terrae]ACB74803.1 conserved hypothetical protein [Opitutus terrae PB90-1]
MKTTVRLLLFCCFWACGARAAAADDFAAVTAADRARIAATIAGDTLKLAELLSDDLRYAHADGRVQTKAQFISAVASNKVQYLSFTPEDVALQAIAPGVVAMQGGARLAARAEGQRHEFTLRFLAVWRQENDRWRLVAYQSAQLAAAPARRP